MANSSDLVFSAHSLQSYADCQRRFELNYLKELKWPAVESEPLLASERHMDDGRRFHEMIHRDLLGIALTEPDARRDPDIARWWASFQDHRPTEESGKRFAEKQLVGSVGDRTLLATCDLITMEADGRARIYDWKTWRRRHSRSWLSERLQTRVYPYLLVTTGAAIAGGAAVEPRQIEMVYWYAEFPDDPEIFAYDAEQFARDRAYLSKLVEEIASKSAPRTGDSGGVAVVEEPGEFPMTTDHRQCAYCPYRSFCDRGVAAGSQEEAAQQGLELGNESTTTPLLDDLDDYDAVAF